MQYKIKYAWRQSPERDRYIGQIHDMTAKHSQWSGAFDIRNAQKMSLLMALYVMNVMLQLYGPKFKYCKIEVHE